ncbi:MAG: hypothetical protein ACHQVK_02305, partial [Candidatus Paceibacterales bacterium]
MLFRKLFIFLLSSLIFITFPRQAKAADDFSVDATVTDTVTENGQTSVSHDLTLQNNFSTLYATTYTLALENIDTQNVTAVDDKGQVLQTDIQKDGDKTNIKVTFGDAVVGKDAKRHFVISYNNGSFATRTGEVWEVSIPRLGTTTSFRNYSILLLIPDSFGLEAYVSPKPLTFLDNNGFKNYTFDKTSISQTGITAGFGQFQVFSFTLAYHLENPLAIPSQAQIALPPDTAFQKVYLQKIDPKPDNVTLDSDGNWLANYKLNPRQRVDVTAVGAVQI